MKRPIETGFLASRNKSGFRLRDSGADNNLERIDLTWTNTKKPLQKTFFFPV